MTERTTYGQRRAAATRPDLWPVFRPPSRQDSPGPIAADVMADLRGSRYALAGGR